MKITNITESKKGRKSSFNSSKKRRVRDPEKLKKVLSRAITKLSTFHTHTEVLKKIKKELPDLEYEYKRTQLCDNFISGDYKISVNYREDKVYLLKMKKDKYIPLLITNWML